MSIEAVALIKIPFKDLVAPFEQVEVDTGAEPPLTILTGENGAQFGVQDLTGGTAVHTGLPLRTDASDVALNVRHLLGDVLDAHKEPRGILIFPTAASPKPASWEALVEELKDGADWTAVPTTDQVPSPFPDASGGLAGLMGQVMQMMGPDVGRLAQAVSSGDNDALNQAARGLQSQIEGSGQADALQAAFGQFLGGAPAVGEDDAAGSEEAGEELDLSALMAQASALAAQNPDLINSIRSEMSGKGDAAPVDGGDLKKLVEKVLAADDGDEGQ